MTKQQLETRIKNQKDKLEEYLLVIENLKLQIQALEDIHGLCYVCGCKDNLTRHHVFKHDEDKTTKESKGKLTIILCRACHDQVENVKKLMFMYKKKSITYEHVKSALKNTDDLYKTIAENEEH